MKKPEYLETVGIDKKFQNIDFNTFSAYTPEIYKKLKKYDEKLEQAISQNKGLFLTGSMGTGKTTIGCYFIQKLGFKPYRMGLYRGTSEDIVTAFASRWTNQSRYDEYTEHIKNIGVLFIDDLGKEVSYPNVAKKFIEGLLKHRLEANKMTFIASENTAKFLGEFYQNENIRDLIRILAFPVSLTKSFYLERSKKEYEDFFNEE